MVKDEVVNCLVHAIQYLNNSSFSGSPRHAITEAYSAVDAAFSAVLRDGGVLPPRNHKEKLRKIRNLYPKLLDSYTEMIAGGGIQCGQGVAWDEIEAFYEDWLKARYEQFSAEPIDARIRCIEAHRVFACAIRFVAKNNDLDVFGFEEKIKSLAFGFLFSKADIAVSDVQERRCDAAERYGEMHGYPVGARLSDTSNYCRISISANDALTQMIVEEDALIAEECSQFYEQFMRIVEHVQNKRHDALAQAPVNQNNAMEEPDSTPNFMLSIKVSFHGQKISELPSYFLGRKA
jgi:hypothetical protein